MIEYPAFFPCPTWEYQEQTEASVDRSLFQCGWARQRRRWIEFTRDIGIAFVMDTRTFATWSTWAEANGHDWFTIIIDGQPVIMRFTGEVQFEYGAFDTVRVTTTGELQGG